MSVYPEHPELVGCKTYHISPAACQFRHCFRPYLVVQTSSVDACTRSWQAHEMEQDKKILEMEFILSLFCALVILALLVILVGIVFVRATTIDTFAVVRRFSDEKHFIDPTAKDKKCPFPYLEQVSSVDLSVIVPSYNEEQRYVSVVGLTIPPPPYRRPDAWTTTMGMMQHNTTYSEYLSALDPILVVHNLHGMHLGLQTNITSLQLRMRLLNQFSEVQVNLNQQVCTEHLHKLPQVQYLTSPNAKSVCVVSYSAMNQHC